MRSDFFIKHYNLYSFVNDFLVIVFGFFLKWVQCIANIISSIACLVFYNLVSEFILVDDVKVGIRAIVDEFNSCSRVVVGVGIRII